MRRAPFQILIFPYRVKAGIPVYAIFQRTDLTVWQAVAGGGIIGESVEEAARRELAEETGLRDVALRPLRTKSVLPAQAIGSHWGPEVTGVSEHAFGVPAPSRALRLSPEHRTFEWVSFATAMDKLEWESNRRALGELHARLTQPEVEDQAALIMVRKFEASDQAAFEHVLREGLQAQARYVDASSQHAVAGFVRTEWEEHMTGVQQRDGHWWVAEVATDVVGVMWVVQRRDPLGPYASVRQLIVRSQFRGRGVGSQMLTVAKNAAHEAGVVMLLISTHVQNPAQRLYERLGFTDMPSAFRNDPDPTQRVMWQPFAEGLQ